MLIQMRKASLFSRDIVVLLLLLVALGTTGIIANHEHKTQPKVQPVQTGSVVQDLQQPKWVPQVVAPTITPAPTKTEEVESETPQELGSSRIDDLVEVVWQYAWDTEYTKLNKNKLHTYITLADRYARKQNFDTLWILAIIWQESRFNPKETSGADAIGLMQMTIRTGKGYGYTAKRLYDPETNLIACITHLSNLRKKYDGNLRTATTAYNQGTGNVARGTARTWYYKSVLNHFNKLKLREESLDGKEILQN
jgi:hypothetical protein